MPALATFSFTDIPDPRPQEVWKLLDRILDSPLRRGDTAAQELFTALSRLVEDVAATELSENSIRGTLSTRVAGHCIEDAPRTWRFVHAIRDAVRAYERRYPNQEMFIVDAGCGPFAFLAAVAARESPWVRGLALESNQRSADFAVATLERLGLGNRIAVVRADAASFPVAKPISLLLTETFDCGLQLEQGAAIMKNFAKYMAVDGVMLPQTVIVEAAIRRYRGALPMSARYWKPLYRAGLGEAAFEVRPVTLHDKLRPGKYELFVSTRLRFGSEVADLDRWSGSPISHPEKLADFKVGREQKSLIVSINPGRDEPAILVS